MIYLSSPHSVFNIVIVWDTWHSGAFTKTFYLGCNIVILNIFLFTWHLTLLVQNIIPLRERISRREKRVYSLLDHISIVLLVGYYVRSCCLCRFRDFHTWCISFLFYWFVSFILWKNFASKLMLRKYWKMVVSVNRLENV